jgi:hypothetical protein
MSKENRIDVEQYRAYRKGAPPVETLPVRGERAEAADAAQFPPNDIGVRIPADTEELSRVPR